MHAIFDPPLKRLKHKKITIAPDLFNGTFVSPSMQVCFHPPPTLPARPSYGSAQLNRILSSLPFLQRPIVALDT